MEKDLFEEDIKEEKSPKAEVMVKKNQKVKKETSANNTEKKTKNEGQEEQKDQNKKEEAPSEKGKKEENGKKGGRESRSWNRGHSGNNSRQNFKGQRVRPPLSDEELASEEFVYMAPLKEKPFAELLEMAQKLEVESVNCSKPSDLIYRILQKRAQLQENIYCEGVLHILDEGYGFLRSGVNNYKSAPDDIYISSAQIRYFSLKTGDTVSGQVRYPRDSEKYFALYRIHKVNGDNPENCKRRVHFSSLTPLHPTERFFLENKANKDNLSMRIMDLLAPIGKGQRGLIVAPPKSGKTMFLQNVANSILRNYPDVKMTVLLIDERPEEVTDMKRSVDAEVISSTFDEPPESHVHVAEMVVEKARRLAEKKT